MQLRDAIELLRARVGTLTESSVQQQRQLAQAEHLAPLFERLGERFTFRTPEEVLDRLELLEGDQLGAMDQLQRVRG